VTQITREAREGITRAWIDLLKQRHPNVSWIVTERTPEIDDEPLPHQQGGSASDARSMN